MKPQQTQDKRYESLPVAGSLALPDPDFRNGTAREGCISSSYDVLARLPYPRTENIVNNVRQATREQEVAADFMADYFDRVIVGTPNAIGMIQLIGVMGMDVEMLKWTIDPAGRLVHADSWKHGATVDYVDELRTRIV